MRSLRLQLLLGTAPSTIAVLLVFGAVLYALINQTLWAEFDQSLAAKARLLATLTEQEHDGLDFEPVETPLREFEPSDHAEYFQLWLSDNRVLARSPSLLDANLDRIAGPSDSPAFKTVTFPDGRPGRIVGIEFVPRQDNEHGIPLPPHKMTLVVGREITGLLDTLARIRGLLIGVCLIAVVLSSGVLTWAVHRSLRPVEHLSRQIATVDEEDLGTQLNAGQIPKELSPVVGRLNELLARLAAAFQRERRFTGDVAHELRTPLAGLRSKLELALSRDRAGEEYRGAMGDCLGITLQMQRLVENLMNLTRADAGQLEVQRETINLPETVRDCWKPLREKAETRGLNIQWQLDDARTVETDLDKLHLVLANILDNAVTYANDGGTINISMSHEDEIVELAVSNTGSTLPTEDTQHVFDRFWRGDSSYPASEGHYGLGLPLCKAVLEQLGGSIQASTPRDGSFVLTIRLPRTQRTRTF